MGEQATFDVGAPQVRRFTLLELISCAEWEVKMRKQVYPMRIANRQVLRE